MMAKGKRKIISLTQRMKRQIKAKSMYSRNTNALLLAAIELVGIFVILRGGFKNGDNR